MTLESFKNLKVHWPAIPALVAGWLVTAIAIKLSVFYQISNEKKSFEYLIKTEVNEIQNKKDSFQVAMRAAADFVETSGKFDSKNWRHFVRNLFLENNLAQIHGLGFIEPVRRKDYSNWLVQRKIENRGEFNVHSLIPEDLPANQDELFIITSIEPMEKNGQALGLNLSSESRRQSGLIKSKLSHSDVLTEPIYLVQDSVKRAGFLYLHPIYLGSKFFGWVYAPIIAQELFEESLGILGDQLGYQVSLNGQPVYNSVTRNKPEESSSEWKFADQTFVFSWWKAGDLSTVLDRTTAWVILVGSLISILVSIVIANFQMTKEQAQTIADLATRDLKLSQDQLVQAAKFAALGEMAAGVAHEINNPLTIIKGRVEQMRHQFISGSITADGLHDRTVMIDKAIDRISKIISGLKTFSRNGEKEEQIEISLQELLDESLALCQERFKNRGVELRIKIPENHIFSCQPTHVSQVLLNLLNNAFDAVVNLKERWVEVSARQVQDRIEIVVMDSGKGIPEEVAKKIMQPFFTTKEIGKGTGLGLSISRGIIEAHQGSLTFDSSCLHTRFVISLPIFNQSEKIAA